MQIIYREDMLDRIDKIIGDAERKGRVILAIELSRSEWLALAKNLEDRELEPHNVIMKMMDAHPGMCYLHKGVVLNLEKTV